MVAVGMDSDVWLVESLDGVIDAVAGADTIPAYPSQPSPQALANYRSFLDNWLRGTRIWRPTGQALVLPSEVDRFHDTLDQQGFGDSPWEREVLNNFVNQNIYPNGGEEIRQRMRAYHPQRSAWTARQDYDNAWDVMMRWHRDHPGPAENRVQRWWRLSNPRAALPSDSELSTLSRSMWENGVGRGPSERTALETFSEIVAETTERAAAMRVLLI